VGASVEDALHGGEDFELVFALPPTCEPPDGAIRIGVCTPDPSVRTLGGEPLEPRGWEHSL
jgi:thiamine monophosphate kinase